MFPGFMGFDKIDDCNVKLSFSSKEECQTLLTKNSKDKSSFTTEHIIDPFEISIFFYNFRMVLAVESRLR